MKHDEHYSEDYFKWQKVTGEFGSWANIDKFQKHLNPEQVVVDFGCGGGYLLNAIDAKEKVGIEVNDTAIENCTRLGVKTVKNSKELPENYADIIISNSALEHARMPLEELIGLRRVLKPGGKIVVVVPCEHIKYKYDPEKDINYHLYSWSPMNLGNLINEAGFNVSECEAYKHKWPPLYIADRVRKHLGRKAFNILCKIYSRIENSWFQVRAVATKPMDSE